MATIIETGASAPTFDAPAWFADWSDSGGIAIATDDRLYLSRGAIIDAAAHRRLDALRDEIVRDRNRGEALAAFLRGRREART